MFDPASIPPIGTPTSPATAKGKKSSLDAMLHNAPAETTLGIFFGKILMGLIIGGCISALLFAVLSVVGGMIDTSGTTTALGPLLALIGFVAGMLGNMGLALLYNLFFSKRYHSLQQMLGLIFTSSILIAVICFFLYLLPFPGGITTLFTILGVQILFSFFITANLLEFLAQPNYSASSLLGTTFGFILSMVIFMSFTLSIQSDEINNQIFKFMLVPTIVGYTVLIAGSEAWNAIYYKLFQRGNNPFYLKSPSELSKEELLAEQIKEKEKEEVNVDM